MPTSKHQPHLIIPDIHEQSSKLNYILTKYSHIRNKVYLGDWFDNFSEPWQYFVDVVTLFQEACEDPNSTLILGNHDASYRWGGGFRCSGWQAEKHHYIQSHITQDEWNRTVLWAKVGKFICSHAGIHKWILGGRMPTKPLLNSLCASALAGAPLYRIHRVLGAGWARGGGQKVGGLIWLDWNEEFEPIPNIHQIVGHTNQRDHKYKSRITPNSENYCLDTALRCVGIVEGNTLVVEEI